MRLCRPGAIVACFLTAVGGPIYGQDHSQGRSMVISQHGIAATEHPLASQAAATILANGGHAVDAAITANAVMGVVAPMWNGIGGDLFAIIYDAETGSIHGLNASGWSPAALTLDRLDAAGSVFPKGIHSVTVPGAVAGWGAMHERFGRMRWAELFAAAIKHAEDGFPVAELNAQIWLAFAPMLREVNARRLYLPDDRAPVAGEVFHNPDLARTLGQIATDGTDAFYRGPITDRVLAYSRRQGGTLSRSDFAEYSPEWVIPLSSDYRNWTVYEIPPSSQGIAALSMLNILENAPLQTYGHNSAASLHTMIEAKKLAYADLEKHVADMRFANVPITEMLSKTNAGAQAELIDPVAAACEDTAGSMPDHAGDTIYLSIVDRDGNMVSLIQSVYFPFGSGLVADGTGFALQNRGELFSLDPDHPNALAPRKRPLHTIIPGFMESGDTRIAFGIMGGWNQAQAHAQFVSNIVDYGMNIQAAIEAARFSKRTFAGCDVMVESRIPVSAREELTRRGHLLEIRGAFSGQMGGGQAVLRDFATGVNYGASDPRKDGAAIPEPVTID